MTRAVLLLALVLPSVAPTPPAALARGKALFESKALGTNGRRCADCHAGGKRFEEVATTDDAALADYVNSCIEGMLAGTRLPPRSEELRALVSYVRSVAPKGK
jgi:mono/diheme cytochrome c family protein